MIIKHNDSFTPLDDLLSFISLFLELGYGHGLYFEVDASQVAQDPFSKPNPKGEKFMYVSRVLTGKFTDGQRGMVEPPINFTSGSRFDSVVDKVKKPSLFVIFNCDYVYPEYLITFSWAVSQLDSWLFYLRGKHNVLTPFPCYSMIVWHLTDSCLQIKKYIYCNTEKLVEFVVYSSHVIQWPPKGQGRSLKVRLTKSSCVWTEIKFVYFWQ